MIKILFFIGKLDVFCILILRINGENGVKYEIFFMKGDYKVFVFLIFFDF